jgi:hypothetical protein
VEWLYDVIRNRARRIGAPLSVRTDLVQDAMSSIVVTLHSRRSELATHTNPASALEYLVIHAVREELHNLEMRGYGGVAKNGRNVHTPRPRQAVSFNIDEVLVAPALRVHADDRVAAATRRLGDWVLRTLGLKLTVGASDATTYVLDRLRGGASRTTLVRGGHSSLSIDPAMRVLGFDRESAGAFGLWLLGRKDRQILGVLDSAALEIRADAAALSRWRGVALGFGFAVPTGSPPPGQLAQLDHPREAGRRIA